MSTWLEQYAAQLHGISNTTGSVMRGGDARDAIHALLAARGATPGKVDWQELAQHSKGKSLASMPGDIKDQAIDGGSRILDLLSRFNYASASAVRSLNADENNAEKHGSHVGLFGQGVDYQWGKALKEAGSGFAGRNKSTYSDVFRDNGMSGRGIGTAGFIADVALDPTTYIGAGAIKSVIKGGFKAVGKEVPKLGRARNVLRTEDVFTPEEKVAREVGQKGTSNPAPSSVVQKLLDAAQKNISKPEADQLPFDVKKSAPAVDVQHALEDTVDAPTPPTHTQLAMDYVPPAPTATQRLLQIEGPPKARFTADAAGNIVDRPWHNPVERFKAETALNSATKTREEILSGIEARRYADNVQIDPMHAEVTQDVMQPFMKDVSEQIPNPKKDPTPILVAAVNAIRGENYVKTADGFNIFGRSGYPLKINVKTGAQVSDVAVVGRKDLVQMMRENKVPKALKGAHFKVNGKLIPVEEYVAQVAKDVDAATLFEDDTITRSWKEVEMRKVSQTTIRKFTPVERMAWVAKHKDILDPEDLKLLVQHANLGPKAFASAVSKVKGKIARRNFSSVAELDAARKAGLLTDVGRQVLESRLTRAGVKHPYQVEKRVEKFQKELARATEKPTKVNKARVAKAEKEAVEAVDKANVKANLSMDAADEIMKAPEVVADVAARVDKVAGGDVTDFIRPRTVLNEKQAAIVKDVMKFVNDAEFVNPKNQPYRTARGVMRDSPVYGEGKGWAKGFNKYSQMTLGKRVISEASKLVRGTPALERPAAMYDMTMPMLHASEQVLRQHGIPIILGKSASGLPLSMHDVLSALPRKFVEQYYFNPEAAFDITQLADITEQYILKGLGRRDARTVEHTVQELIGNPTRKGGGHSPYNLDIQKRARYNPHSASASERMGDLIEDSASEIDDAFTKAMPQLMKSLADNSSMAAIKVGEETKALTNAGMEAFNKVVTDPSSPAGSVIKAALDSHLPVVKAAKEAGNAVSGEARALAEQGVAAHVADTLPMPVVATYGRAADSFAKAIKFKFEGKWTAEKALNEFNRIQAKLADSADVEAKTIMDDLGYDVLDLGMRAEFTNGVRMFRAIAPHLGNENLRPILTERLSVNQSLAKRFTNQLARVNAQFDKKTLSEAFARLQTGAEADNPAMEALQSVMKEIFDKDPAYGLMARNGIRLEALQSKFAHFGIGDAFKLDARAMDESWKKWPVLDDPLDFMSKFHAATSAVVAENQIGADISRMFGQPRPGANGKWVQIRDPHGRSKLATLINRDLFYPEDIARQMHMIDTTLTELAKPHSQSAFLRVLDSALHSYKAGVTIYRPGHHVRNMVGDMWLSSMDGVKGSAYKRAFAVLATRQSQYADFDAIRALQDAYKVEGQAPKSILNLTYKGKKIALSPEEVYRMAFDNGTIPDYSVLEDISFGSTQQADKVAESLKKVSPLRLIGKQGQLHKAATGVSEYRDHYVRIAHFIHAMEQQKLVGGTLEEALKSAAHSAGNRVRKWHPDGSDLSDFEKRYARRGILFYSWVRKAIPLVVESMVTRPGRVMFYPKALQNMAAANGIDLEGQSGFPADQLFPSYIADSVQGPQWGQSGSYMGIKPGIPSMDVLDEYASSPKGALQAVMGSANPLFKVPTEVASGNFLRTGTPIQDKSDYVDSQIPGMNYLGKLLGGKSPSSALVPGDGQFMQDTRVSPSNKNYAGNESGPFGANPGANDFINWLLGLGLTDYSRPSSIVSAQREKSGR